MEKDHEASEGVVVTPRSGGGNGERGHDVGHLSLFV